MDFGKGEKAVTIAAIFDERGLQRGLYACNLGKVDVAAQLAACRAFKIEFFETITGGNDDPCFFRVDGIHQHSLCSHKTELRALARRRADFPKEGPLGWRNARRMV
ncbi:hypothetical protein GCM10010862_39360 [Devosia nitrariae]|uniref:GTP cyclohydrolase I n=1 Tax=Devosia nitrariae TaxID=2071872 RepID=A0ABQ5WA00_9HYPH|nr:hypothetical protein GCM10010862_39360 [Devosia nitrariae]